MMSAQLYAEEWDSEDFQIALKVVLKTEIQALLERLAETGEETVLLTASRDDECTGHLSSHNAQKFVDSNDVSILKNKFLCFVRGDKVQPTQTSNQGKTFLANAGLQNIQNKGQGQMSVQGQQVQQQKMPAKRPAEALAPVKNIAVPIPEAKRQKIETVPQSKQAQQSMALLPSNKTSAQVTQTLAKTLPQKAQAKSDIMLKTTKVVSKTGGFTEERLSDAEFKKFLQQYNPHFSEEEEDEEEDEGVIVQKCALLAKNNVPFSGSQPSQTTSVKGPLQTGNKVPNQVTTTNSAKAVTSAKSSQPSNQAGNLTVRKPLNDLEKDCSVPATQRKQLDVDPKLKLDGKSSPLSQSDTKSQTDKLAQCVTANAMKENQISKAETANKEKKELDLDDIDNIDTETLIRMTKQKHLENMSEADKQIHAKLGQLSSKLSWVVEYPQKSSEQGSKSAQGPVAGNQTQPGVMAASQISQNLALYEMFHDMEDDDEEDIEDFDEDDDEFNEDDLDEEDRAQLQKMREAHLKKLGSLEQLQQFQREDRNYMVEGVSQADYDGEENYPGAGEEGEEYNEYEEDMGMVHGLEEGTEEGEISQGQYQRSSSPTMDNFVMIGPFMAKCCLCNKIVRKTETKQHIQTHIANYEGEEEDENYEEEEGYEEEEPYDEQEDEEYPEDGEVGDYGDVPEFTAEKLEAEPFVAEKIANTPENGSGKKLEKSTVCDICNKKFVSHSNMMRHKAIHTDTKNFACPVCPKTFKLQNYLTKHMRKSHKDYKEPEEKDKSAVQDSVEGDGEEQDLPDPGPVNT